MEEKRKGRRMDFQTAKNFQRPPSLPPSVVPFLFFQPALINEANQLAAEREAAERGSLQVGPPKYPATKCVEDITRF